MRLAANVIRVHVVAGIVHAAAIMAVLLIEDHSHEGVVAMVVDRTIVVG